MMKILSFKCKWKYLYPEWKHFRGKLKDELCRNCKLFELLADEIEED